MKKRKKRKNSSLKTTNRQKMRLNMRKPALKMQKSLRKLRKKLVKMSRNAHVDGVAAILDAMCMRQTRWNELGAQLKNEG